MSSPSQPLRVLLVSALLPPFHTGAGLRFLGYGADLRRRGIELQAFSATPPPARAAAAGIACGWDTLAPGTLLPPEAIGGIPVQRIRLSDAIGRARTLQFSAATRAELLRVRPDAVFLLEHSLDFLPVLATARALGIGSGLAYTLLVRRSAGWRRLAEAALWPLVFTLADGVAVNARAMATSLASLGVGRPVDIIVNGVDTTRFAPCGPGEREALRRELALAPDRRVLISVGALSERKGTDLLLDAFRHIARARPDVDLVLVGPWLRVPAHGTDEFHADLQRRLDALGARVRLVGQTQRVDRWLRAADAFLFASVREGGVPNALLEAMASGCPIVTCTSPVWSLDGGPPAGALRETDRTPEGYVEATLALLSAPDAARNMAARARRWVVETRDREHTLEAYATFFRRIAGR